MKITGFVMMLILICSSLFSLETDVFLENYFGTAEYTCKVYRINNKDTYVAYKSKMDDVFDKALFFLIDGPSIQPLLYITDNRVQNDKGEVLFEAIVKNQVFFGWAVSIYEQNSSISTKFYTNNGANVTEGPIVIWDNQKGGFKKYVVDKSLW